MESEDFGVPSWLDEQALQEQAEAMIERYGSRAIQQVVDDIQRALRCGHEAEAMRHDRLLRRIEGMIDVVNGQMLS
jgi:hypothetical protein